MTTSIFKDAFLEQIRYRLFEECVPRLKKCLSELTEAEIWKKPNAQSNSIGNLVIHLNGNVRQWVLNGLGGYPDVRQRQSEFDQRAVIPTMEMLAELDEIMAKVAEILDGLQEADLIAKHPVQCYEETGISILIHVVEHFSYHVGQMTYAVKWMKNVDMGYYEGHNLG